MRYISYTKNSPFEHCILVIAHLYIPLALKALPNCNITYIDGEQMKTALSAFYDILFAMAPSSIGGALPDDGLYYVK